MDPNAAADALRQALEDGDQDAAREYAQAIDQWVARGGFPPANDPRR
jgi:hypothetical protein